MNLMKTITVLGVAAMLGGCVTESTYKKEVNTADTYEQINTQLQGEVSADQAEIQQLQGVIRVTLANGILFPEGGWQLSEKGKATLDRLAPVLATLGGQRIEIKGYTDNLPIGPELKDRFPNNVALSNARAQSVANELVTHGVPAGMLAVTGYGDADPVASNETPQGRAKNRRVVMDIISAN
ncbi:MAG TPA: OmpA family protein [Burkholderiaceae bacterium]|nr:OmpA family protein [Burkholderiaceae bacterium]